jgi:hypothetical protein
MQSSSMLKQVTLGSRELFRIIYFGLFTDGVSSSDYIELNGRVITK